MSPAITQYEPSPSVEAFLRREKGINAEQTWKNRRTDLKDFEQWWRENNGDDIIHARPLDIEPFFFERADDGYAAKTIKSRYNSLSAFYRYLSQKRELIEESPFESMDRKDYNRFMSGTKKSEITRDKISYVTTEQAEQLAENVANPRLRNELLIKLAFQTGLREGELASIELSDIDRDDRSIKIRAEKTHENRTVYYQPSLDMLLQQWINGGYRDSYSKAGESQYLFLSIHAPKLESARVNKVVKQAAENAGIQETMYVDMAGNERKKITSHALRHGHAVESLKSGIDVRTVQKHLGHAELDMTMRYLQLIEDDVKQSYQQFGSR
ncbi:tyrosine-type recombinase/integrase [Halococcus sediminicola]|uniref:tyrosine-type recombinase/integrase n=1 Tax=Halococcus sediminicola TaxID=1264579 RepID=UPI000678C78B|nr:tyrosine-type recombinase/integrase [Halococcus sediminicola]